MKYPIAILVMSSLAEASSTSQWKRDHGRRSSRAGMSVVMRPVSTLMPGSAPQVVNHPP